MLEGVVASIAALPQTVGGSGAVYLDTLHRGYAVAKTAPI